MTQYRTVGRPQAGVGVALRDEAGAPVPDSAVGRVHVRSTCVMRGHWGDPELPSAALSPDSWLRSGDLARWDAAANLVLCGRADDMYIRGGYNVYPLEVEHVLAEHPGVGDVSVIGMTAPVIGEIGVAFGPRCRLSGSLDRGPAVLVPGAAGGLQGSRRGRRGRCVTADGDDEGGQGGSAHPRQPMTFSRRSPARR